MVPNFDGDQGKSRNAEFTLSAAHDTGYGLDPWTQIHGRVYQDMIWVGSTDEKSMVVYTAVVVYTCLIFILGKSYYLDAPGG